MKTFLTAFAAVCLIVTPVLACVQSVASTPEQIEVCVASDACFRINTADLRMGSDALRSEQVQELITGFLQTRQTLAGLEPVDPDKAENPRVGERIFWSDVDGVERDTVLAGATHITSQSCMVEAVIFDRASGVFVLTIRRAI